MKEMTRQERLEGLRRECADHPGTMHICGVDIDMTSLEEVKLALLWVSTNTTALIDMLQRKSKAQS